MATHSISISETDHSIEATCSCGRFTRRQNFNPTAVPTPGYFELTRDVALGLVVTAAGTHYDESRA